MLRNTTPRAMDMNKSSQSSQLIWLVEIEPPGSDGFYAILPKEMCRSMKRVNLPAALKLLEEKIKPSVIFLEGQPGKAMQNAMAQINEIQPTLPVLVISRWQNASEMRSWFTRYFVEMARATPSNNERRSNAYQLSARELQIVQLMVKGLIKKEIAEQLSISYHTVDNHERNIFRKMNTHTRTAVVAKTLIEKIL